MTKVYKVSDDGQLIKQLTTEEVKEIARGRRANAPRSSSHSKKQRA